MRLEKKIREQGRVRKKHSVRKGYYFNLIKHQKRRRRRRRRRRSRKVNSDIHI